MNLIKLDLSNKEHHFMLRPKIVAMVKILIVINVEAIMLPIHLLVLFQNFKVEPYIRVSLKVKLKLGFLIEE